MTKVAEFHTTGIEDVDELVFHNQSGCPIGQEIKKKGTAAAGQGYFEPSASNAKVSKKAGMPIGLSSDGVVTPSGSSLFLVPQLAYLFDARHAVSSLRVHL